MKVNFRLCYKFFYLFGHSSVTWFFSYLMSYVTLFASVSQNHNWHFFGNKNEIFVKPKITSINLIFLILRKFEVTVLLRQSERFKNLIRTVLKKSFLTIPKVEIKFWSSYETLESTGEMILMTKFYLCLYNFSELSYLFSRVRMKVVLSVMSGNQY